mgnify:FL=1
MEDKLIEILETFGYSVVRQGSLGPDEEYPDSFFTFWNNDSPDHAHYDNAEYGTEWDFDVNFYSINPEKTYQVLADARIQLKQNKWIIPGKGYDVASDEVTHTGRGMRVFYLEF